MQLNDNDRATITARLQEAKQGLDEVFAMIEANPDAGLLISKLNDCSKMLDRASFALMVSSLQGTAGASEDEKAANIRHLEQLFLHID
ncbi:MAG: hypothetical protein MSC45_10390 [Mobiluncus sp.]|uniref:Uncharacterized protein n=2 Tax=Mobiluncus porci TaxID=2652278 RepID=A0A7K0K3U1_9ACTO|nr:MULTISPECIES: hypothetical protein [Mobiluncus]MCI6585450.1 hypothetical protein [Mobiluncus sp.]MDD7541340.1 hypothetical protein [Mobiluncus porci]MST49705.1 hypothetical protein [Mobiluncus porci]